MMMLQTLSHFLLGTLRGRLIISVATVHAIMMALFIGDLTERQRAMLLDRQIEEATALSQALATSAAGWIATDNISGLQEIVEAQRRYPEILFAILTDKEGRVLADTDKSRQGLYMLDLPREARQTLFGSSPQLVDIAVPAMVGGHHAGWARVGIGQKVAGEKLLQIIRSGVFYALAAILVGSAIAWFMGRRITRRLYAVQETIDAVRSGDRLARSTLTGTDEAAVMAREFNTMLDVIVHKDAELVAKTKELERYFTDALDLLCIADTDGYFRRLNPAWEATLGLPVAELEGRRLLDFVHPDDMEETRLVIARLADQQEVLSFSNRYRGSNGDYRWIEWRAFPSGKQIYAVARDITARKRSEEDLSERSMLAELAADIGCALTMQGELRTMLDECVQALVRHLDVAFARIWTLNAPENVLELQASAGMYTKIDGSHGRVPVGKFKIGLIAERREPHITNAVQGDPLVHDQEWAKREGMVAFAGHPLTIDDKLVGVMGMFSRTKLTAVTLKALASVSNEIAIGIERKLAEEALQRLNRELRAISNCNQVLVRVEDEQTLLNNICRIICDEAGYRMTWVGYAEDDAAKTVRPVAWAGAEDGYLIAPTITWADTELGRGSGGTAVRVGKTDCIQDFATEPKAALWREKALQHGYRSRISLPLKDEAENPFGVLNIYSEKANAFTPDEIRLLEELSADMSFGIMVLRSRTERQKGEETMRLLSSIVEYSDDAIIGKTLEGIITSWNRGAEKIFGYGRSEVAGEPISLLIPDERKDEEARILAKIRRGEHIEHFETIRRRKDGGVLDVSLTVSPIKDAGGRVVGASTIARDITERKRAEEEIRTLNDELEQRVKQRTAELEEKNEELHKMNRLFVGRELRMQELKERIRAMESKYGETDDHGARRSPGAHADS